MKRMIQSMTLKTEFQLKNIIYIEKIKEIAHIDPGPTYRGEPSDLKFNILIKQGIK